MKIHSHRPAVRAFACLALASLLALGLTACSKDSEAGSPAVQPAGNAPAATDTAAKKIGDPVREAETLKAADAARTLRYSAIPNVNTTELTEKNRPLAEYLTKKLGVQVEYVPVADYGASVDAFKNGDLDLCWFGGYTGAQAREAVKGAKAIACGERDKKFKSYFIAHESLGLEPGDEFPMAFKGRKFTFGSPSSTSGRLMPEHFIRVHTGMSPKEFFGAEPSFSNNHDKTIELVGAGTFECGVVDYTVYDLRAKAGKVDPAIEIIWTTPEYFDYQFTVRPDVDARFGAGFTQKLQDVLISIPESERHILAGIQREEDGLIACTNEDFEPLRKTALEIGLLR